MDDNSSHFFCTSCSEYVHINLFASHIISCLITRMNLHVEQSEDTNQNVNDSHSSSQTLESLFSPFISLPTNITQAPNVNSDDSSLYWISLSGLTPPIYGVIDDNMTAVADDDSSVQDYLFNTMIADIIGNVEIGLNDQEINQVSQLIDLNTCKETTCPICLEEYTDDSIVRQIKCSHCFCDDCILKWLNKHKKCPCCQVDLEDKYLSSDDMHPLS